MEALAKAFAKETEIQGVNRADFVLRSLAEDQWKEPLIIVGHAITLAVAMALASPQKCKKESGDGLWSITSFIDMVEEDFIDRVNLGIRYIPSKNSFEKPYSTPTRR
ncbi:hypothetical protein GCK32_022456, partial [Trichostrongylus colubriformis]